MSRTIVAGSTATFIYTPEVEPDHLPTVACYDADGDSVTLSHIVVAAGATWEDGYLLTLEGSESATLTGTCALHWSWEWTDDDGNVNTVHDVEEFYAVTSMRVPVSLTVATNTYVTLDEAETYMAGRLGTTAWDEATEADRAASLLMATRALDGLSFRGRKYDIDQTLEFPRAYWAAGSKTGIFSEENERYSTFNTITGYWYDADAGVPQRVKDAECEEALALLVSGGEEDRSSLMRQGVKAVSFSSFSETYSDAAVSRSRTGLKSVEAMALMRPYIAGNAAVR